MSARRNRDSRSKAVPVVDQPGLGNLREAVALAERKLPKRRTLRHDGLAGFNTAISNVPDGLANGILVGVNPLYGLYATMAGPIAGGLLSSTQLMMITTTAAASMTAGQALAGVPLPDRDGALFLMVIMTGLFQLVLGSLGFGRLTRFVSYSVTSGFLLGISVLLILSQLPTITGYPPMEGNKLVQAVTIMRHPGAVSLASAGVAALTLALTLAFGHTKLHRFGPVIAVAAASLTVYFTGLDVRVVNDIGAIPHLWPRPYLPGMRHALTIIPAALALAAVILVQGAGVSQSVPNPDGSDTNTSSDFVAQGAGNLASGLFHGLPVGGSLSSTAYSVLTGAHTRWAAVFAGVWMAIILIAFPEPVAHVALPALAALLILAGVRSIRPQTLFTVWNAGWQARLAAGTTFGATLLLPIYAAVAIGVALAALLYVYKSSSDISVVELEALPDGRIREHPAPRRLSSNQVTVLDVYGHLFFAGAKTFEHLLPSPRGAARPVVVLRMRGRSHHDATLVGVLAAYAAKLEKAGGRLYLSGLSPKVLSQANRARERLYHDAVRGYASTPIVGESTQRARADAERWLRAQPPLPPR